MAPATDKSAIFSPVALSGLDPVGMLYTDGVRYLRGIRDSGVDQIQTLLNSPFWEELTTRNLVPQTRIIDGNSVPEPLQHFPLVLEHETLQPVTYPHEWSFEMVRTTAFAFLDLIELADSHAYTCKDAHPYNWIFRGVHPVWVDIGSFVPVGRSPDSFPWLEPFFRRVLLPLHLWEQGMPFLASRAVTYHASVISPDEIIAGNYPLLRGNSGSKKKLRAILHRILFAHSTPDDTVPGRMVRRVVTKKPLSKVVQQRRAIKRISYTPASQWGYYHSGFPDDIDRIATDPRFARTIDLIQEYSPASILELAGNKGVLSQVLAEKLPHIPVICTDYDPNAIDSFFCRTQKMPLPNLSMAVHDFMSNELYTAEIDPHQRFRSDCVLAFAVTHHLLLSRGFEYDRIFQSIRSYSDRLVFIEFMPTGVYDGNQALPLPPWYTEHNFEESFSKFFTLLHREELDRNRVLYIGRI